MKAIRVNVGLPICPLPTLQGSTLRSHSTLTDIRGSISSSIKQSDGFIRKSKTNSREKKKTRVAPTTPG
eukprot:16451639-Heterocapsa_arctica.AAC.1